MEKKIGILTFHNALNYGAILQVYALQSKVEELGYDVEIINYHNEYFKDIYDSKLNPFRIKDKKLKLKTFIKYIVRTKSMLAKRRKFLKLSSFIKENLYLSKYYDVNNVNECDNYNIIIVGSDQVWNMDLSKFDLNYYLKFANDNQRLISYAASIGKEYITGFERDNMSRYLKRFYSLSIREKSGYMLLKDLCNINSKIVIDPTLLYGKNFWMSLISKSKLNIKKPYVLVYLVQDSDDVINLAKKIALEEDIDIVSLNKIKCLKKYTNLEKSSINDFLYLINNASYVVTSSFHGLVFSINLNKQFFYGLSRNIPNNNSRLQDLCNFLGLENREASKVSNYNERIDYTELEKKLNVLRGDSIDFLKESLNEEI